MGQIGLVSAAAVLLAASTARADPTAADRAMAQALFDDGRRLMGDHRYADACLKFAESQRLDPSVGTLLNLAVCHEEQKRLASAWEEFKEVAVEAKRDGQAEREQFATSRAAALEPRLSRLTVAPADGADVPGFVVTVDGESLGRAAWGVGMPIDGGTHVVAASAAGRKTWQTSVDVASERDSKTVAIAPLSDASTSPGAGSPAPASATPVPGNQTGAAPADTGPTPAPAGGMPTTKLMGLVSGGVGLAGIALGSVFGALTSSASSQQKSDCASAASCANRAQALSDHSAMETDGMVANVAFIAGGALLATGAVLFFATGNSSPAATSRSVVVAPGLARGGAALSVRAEF